MSRVPFVRLDPKKSKKIQILKKNQKLQKIYLRSKTSENFMFIEEISKLHMVSNRKIKIFFAEIQ